MDTGKIESVNGRLTQIEARLDELDQRVGRLEDRMERLEGNVSIRFEDQHREFFAHLEAARSEIRRVETIADFRERLLFLEAKFAQPG